MQMINDGLTSQTQIGRSNQAALVVIAHGSTHMPEIITMHMHGDTPTLMVIALNAWEDFSAT